MLNISKQIYSAWHSSTKKEIPDAVIIPHGNSAKEEKKLDTITKRYDVLKEFENNPLPGFTLQTRNKKIYQYESSWTVIDPRGFTVQISSENLEKILQTTGITEGLIQERCIWAREDNQTQLSLIPINSKEYREAVVNTTLLENKIDVNDVNIGDEVRLQNGLIGKYQGTLSLYGKLKTFSNSKKEHKIQTYSKRQIIEVSSGKYYHASNLEIIEIILRSKDKLEVSDSVKKLNSEIKQGTAFFSNDTVVLKHGFHLTTYGQVSFVSAEKVPKVKLQLEEIDKLEAARLFNEAATELDIGVVLLEDSQGKRYLIEYPFVFSSTCATIYSFKKLEVEAIDDEKIILKKPHRSFEVSTQPSSKFDDFVKFYKIVKVAKTSTYI